MPKHKHKITKEGLEDLRKQIARKEKQMLELNARKRELGDRWDSSALNTIDLLSHSLAGELSDLRLKLQNCSIIENQNKDESIVNIDDVVVVEIQFAEDDIESSKIKLVADFAGIFVEEGIDRVSIESPLGEAIYGKKVGETYSYNVNGHEVFVKVVSKERKKSESGLGDETGNQPQ